MHYATKRTRQRTPLRFRLTSREGPAPGSLSTPFTACSFAKNHGGLYTRYSGCATHHAPPGHTVSARSSDGQSGALRMRRSGVRILPGRLPRNPTESLETAKAVGFFACACQMRQGGKSRWSRLTRRCVGIDRTLFRSEVRRLVRVASIMCPAALVSAPVIGHGPSRFPYIQTTEFSHKHSTFCPVEHARVRLRPATARALS